MKAEIRSHTKASLEPSVSKLTVGTPSNTFTELDISAYSQAPVLLDWFLQF